jgi:hypothetical protein
MLITPHTATEASAISDLEIQSNQTNDRVVFLSTDVAGKREVRFAIAAILASGAMFLAAAPFAKTQLGQVPAFLP